MNINKIIHDLKNGFKNIFFQCKMIKFGTQDDKKPCVRYNKLIITAYKVFFLQQMMFQQTLIPAYKEIRS